MAVLEWGAQGQDFGLGEKVFDERQLHLDGVIPGVLLPEGQAFSQGLIELRGQGEVPQGGLPGVVGYQERRRVSSQVSAENTHHLRLAGLGGQEKNPGRGFAGEVPPGMGHDAAVYRGPRGQRRRPHDKVFDFRLAGADAGGIPAHGQHPVPGSHGRLL